MFEQLVTIARNKYIYKLTEKYKPFSFVYKDNKIIVVLSFKKKIQIIVFTEFKQKDFFCKATIMNCPFDIYISIHALQRFRQRLTPSKKYSTLELFAKELLYVIAMNPISGWCQANHGKLFIEYRPSKIICQTFYNVPKYLETLPDINWFVEI